MNIIATPKSLLDNIGIRHYTMDNYDPFANYEDYFDSSLFPTEYSGDETELANLKKLLWSLSLFLTATNMQGGHKLAYLDSLEKFIELMEEKYSFTFSFDEFINETSWLNMTGTSDSTVRISDGELAESYTKQWNYDCLVWDWRNRQYIKKFFDRLHLTYGNQALTWFGLWFFGTNRIWILDDMEIFLNTNFGWLTSSIVYGCSFFNTDSTFPLCTYPLNETASGIYIDKDNNCDTYQAFENLISNEKVCNILTKLTISSDIISLPSDINSYVSQDYYNVNNSRLQDFTFTRNIMYCPNTLGNEKLLFSNGFVAMAHNIGTGNDLYINGYGRYRFEQGLRVTNSEEVTINSETYSAKSIIYPTKGILTSDFRTVPLLHYTQIGIGKSFRTQWVNETKNTEFTTEGDFSLSKSNEAYTNSYTSEVQYIGEYQTALTLPSTQLGNIDIGDTLVLRIIISPRGKTDVWADPLDETQLVILEYVFTYQETDTTLFNSGG